MEDVVILC